MTPRAGISSLFGKGVCNLKIWAPMAAIGALLFWLGGETAERASSLWFLEPVLYAVFLFGVWVNDHYHFRQRFTFSHKQAAIGFVVLSWTAGMVYELTLSEAGGLGGMHPKTLPSFILAQGFYWPFALGGLLLIRRGRLTLPEVFFVGGAASLNESVIFGMALTTTIFSPLFFVSPFVLAYFVLVYGVFLAFPLIFIDERLLWSETLNDEAPISMSRKLCYGVAMGLVSFLLFTAWGICMEALFDGFAGFS